MTSNHNPPSTVDRSALELRDPTSLRRLTLQTVAALGLLIALVAAGAFFMRAQLHVAGLWFVDTLGLAGVALGVVVADATGFPIPPDTYLVAAVAGGAASLPLILVAGISSVIGGNIGYFIGKHLHRWRWIERRMKVFRPTLEPLLTRWGATAVILAAWTPIPFSLACWFAGAFGTPWRPFFLASLHRIPRIAVYYYAILLGWVAGS